MDTETNALCIRKMVGVGKFILFSLPLFMTCYLLVSRISLASELIHLSNCFDGVDNDADGKIDFRDFDCFGPNGQEGRDTRGFSDFSPSVDSRIIYVSAASGNDQNSGLLPNQAVQSIAHGKSLLRDGYPDWLLLKRGDTWTEGLGTWTKSGRDFHEPLLISSYGVINPSTLLSGQDVRPLLKTGADHGFYNSGTTPLNHLAIVGIYFWAHTRDPHHSEYVDSSGGSGIRWRGPGGGNDILIEDCFFHSYVDNISIFSSGEVALLINNVRIRRNVIKNAWAVHCDGCNLHQGHSQGIYVDNIYNLSIEDNVFDRNGGTYTIPHDPEGITPPQLDPTWSAIDWFNHNLYLNSGNTGNILVRNNISARSDGFQVRAGGVVQENLFLQNINSLTFGIANNPVPGGVSGAIKRNLFLKGTDFPDESIHAGPRGHAMQIKNTDDLVIKQNILVDDESVQPYSRAIYLNGQNCGDHNSPCAVSHVRIANNLIYNWRGGLQMIGQAGVEISAISVFQNIVQSLGRDQTPFITHSDSFSPYIFLYRNNNYFRPGNYFNWFKVDNLELNFQEWVHISNEHNAHSDQMDLGSLSRALNRYQVLQGGLPTTEDFMKSAIKQTKFIWNENYEPRKIMTYFEDLWH